MLTPFPHTKAWDDLVKQDRIIDRDWNHYNAGKVVFQPKHMSPDRLQELYQFAWDSFYRDETQSQKMFNLFNKVITREIEDGTYRSRRREMAGKTFGREVVRKIG